MSAFIQVSVSVDSSDIAVKRCGMGKVWGLKKVGRMDPLFIGSVS